MKNLICASCREKKIIHLFPKCDFTIKRPRCIACRRVENRKFRARSPIYSAHFVINAKRGN